MLRITLAVLHLLGFGIALGSIFARARALNDVRDAATLKRGFVADNWWGASAGILIATGLWRAFGSLEKASSYYWDNHVFYAKMGLFALVFVLEIWPMVTLIRLRRADAAGALPPIDAVRVTARRIARISDVQLLLLVAIIYAAVMMARGFGAG